MSIIHSKLLAALELLKSEWNSRHCSQLETFFSSSQRHCIVLIGRRWSVSERNEVLDQYLELHVFILIGGIDHHYCCAAAIPSIVHHLESDVALHNPRRKR